MDRAIRYTLGFLAFLILAAGAQSAPRERRELLDRVVARVNHEIITENELLIRAFAETDAAGETLPGARPDLKAVLEAMIEERLLAQAAREEVKEVPAERLANFVEAEIKLRRSFFPTEEAFVAALKERGWDLASYKRYLREQEERVHLVRTALARRVRMNEEEVRAYEQTLRARGESTVQYLLRQIVIQLPPTATAEQEKRAEQRAIDLLERIRRGGPFDQLAREESDEPDARATGGNLGWVDERTLQPAILEAIRRLSDGQTSMPVRTQRGLHIFQMVRKRGARDLLFDKRMEEARRDWAAALRSKGGVKILLGD